MTPFLPVNVTGLPRFESCVPDRLYNRTSGCYEVTSYFNSCQQNAPSGLPPMNRRPVTLCVLKRPSRAALRPVCTAIHLLARLVQHQPTLSCPRRITNRPWMTSLCYLTQQHGVDMKRSALINPCRCAMMARHLSLSKCAQSCKYTCGTHISACEICCRLR